MVAGFMSLLPTKARQIDGVSVRVLGVSDKLPQGKVIESVKRLRDMTIVHTRPVSDLNCWISDVKDIDVAAKNYIIWSNGIKNNVKILPDGRIRVIETQEDGTETLKKLPMKYQKHMEKFGLLKSVADIVNKGIMNAQVRNLASVLCKINIVELVKRGSDSKMTLSERLIYNSFKGMKVGDSTLSEVVKKDMKDMTPEERSLVKLLNENPVKKSLYEMYFMKKPKISTMSVALKPLNIHKGTRTRYSNRFEKVPNGENVVILVG